MDGVSTAPSKEHYRTVVAGAGPAGIMAAYHAAASGPVLLVESGPMPRYKSCGGMLHTETRKTLSQYAPIPDDIVLEPRSVHFRFHDWDRQLRRVTELELLNVDRAGFDAWLADMLPENVEVVANAPLKDFKQSSTGVEVSLKSNGKIAAVTCDNLIGADGGRSQVRRVLGAPNTEQYVTIQDFLRIKGPIEPYFDCIYVRGIGDDYAYTYIVPKGEYAVIGCVYYPHSKRPGLLQDRVVDVLRTRIPSLGECVKREACTALYVRSAKDIVPGSGRVLLAGEAGGFLSPTSGEGISYAVNTGRLAGGAIASATPEKALAAYSQSTEKIRKNIARKFRWLPMMESSLGKYVAGFIPESMVSRITFDL